MRTPLIIAILLTLSVSRVQAVPPAEQRDGLLGMGFQHYGDIYGDNSSFSAAITLLAAGDVAGAKAEYLGLQKQYPDTVGVLELGGLIKLVEGKPMESEGLLRKALQLRDDVASIWAKLGSALIAQNHREEGKSALEKAVKLDPRNSFAHHVLGRLASAEGETAVAIDHYRVAVANAQSYSIMHGELAGLLMATDQAAEAVKLLAPLAANATSSEPLLRLAYAQARSGDSAAALSSAEEVTERFPKDIASLTGVLALMLELGAHELALATVEAGRQEFPNDPILKFQNASVLQMSGRSKEAEKYYREILENPQGRVLALNNLSLILVEQSGRGVEAIKMAREASEMAPGNPAILDTLGWVLYRDGQAPEALTHLRKAASNSHEPGLLCHLAIVTAQVDGADKAEDLLRQCAQSDADSQLTQLASKRLAQ